MDSKEVERLLKRIRYESRCIKVMTDAGDVYHSGAQIEADVERLMAMVKPIVKDIKEEPDNE